MQLKVHKMPKSNMSRKSAESLQSVSSDQKKSRQPSLNDSSKQETESPGDGTPAFVESVDPPALTPVKLKTPSKPSRK